MRLRCQNCERCTWNTGPNCGKAEHPHCEKCGHCQGRHQAWTPAMRRRVKRMRVLAAARRALALA